MKDIKENFEILGTSSRENFSNILHTSSISEFLKLTKLPLYLEIPNEFKGDLQPVRITDVFRTLSNI